MLKISKSAQVGLDFQGPVVTLKIEAVVHEMFVASASSMTEGGVVGNVGAAVSVVPSVILDLSVLRNRLFGPRRGGERLRGAVGIQPTLPYHMRCAILASLSVFDFLPRQAGEARRGQGGAQRPSLKLQPICSVTLTARLEARWRAPP